MPAIYTRSTSSVTWSLPCQCGYLDLVAGGLVFLPVDASMGASVPTDHVLVQLLWNVEIGHADQVTAVLRGG